jgi:hypothetical protein
MPHRGLLVYAIISLSQKQEILRSDPLGPILERNILIVTGEGVRGLSGEILGMNRDQPAGSFEYGRVGSPRPRKGECT